MNAEFDLENRLLGYAAEIVRFTEQMVDSRAGKHVAGQLPLLQESDELIRVFFASIHTAQRRLQSVRA